jgi:hypothetical protein
MVSSSVRHLCSVAFWIAVVALLLAANVWAVMEHYLAADAALRLVFREQPELFRDGLLGNVLGAFVPNATLTQALALTISVLQTIAMFFVAHLTYAALEMWKLRSVALQAGDPAEAREAASRIVWMAAMVVPILALLALTVPYDVELFRFRALAGALGKDSPELALDVPYSSSLAGDVPFSVVLAGIGARAYVALVLLGAWLLEVSFDRLADRWTFLMRPVDEWAADDEDDEEPGAADDAAETEATAGSETPSLPAFERSASPVEANVGARPAQSPPAWDEAPVAPQAETLGTPRDAAAGGPSPAPPTPAAAGTQRPVIGGTPGESVSLEDARRHPERYHVDPATLRVWNRAVWDALHAGAATA